MGEWFFSDGYNIKLASFFHAWLALWVLAARVRLFLLGSRPLRWMEFSKFRWVLLCALACMG